MAETDSLNLTVEVGSVVREVDKNDGWTVMVCPTPEVADACGKLVSVMAPAGVVSGGRTFKFPNDGRLSVTAADGPLFVPDGTPFAVAFLGWSSKDDGKGMTKWANKAAKIFRG